VVVDPPVVLVVEEDVVEVVVVDKVVPWNVQSPFPKMITVVPAVVTARSCLLSPL
jgi:hypothetical protein